MKYTRGPWTWPEPVEEKEPADVLARRIDAEYAADPEGFKQRMTDYVEKRLQEVGR